MSVALCVWCMYICRLKTLLGPLDAIFQRPETTIMERLKVKHLHLREPVGTQNTHNPSTRLPTSSNVLSTCLHTWL